MKSVRKLLVAIFMFLALAESAYAAGDSPLFKARDKAEVEALLAKGADINARNNEGDTMLLLAASSGKKDIVEWLLAQGADVNAKGKDEETPLHRAAYSGQKDIAELLLAQGADVNARNREERPPLRMAVGKGSKGIAELLLAKGADVNAVDQYGTPLHLAAIMGNIDIAELLLAKGAQINRKESSGGTVLHFVARGGNKAMAEWLLAKGAEVNAKNKEGETPLHYASSSGKKDIAELLIAKGADTNAMKQYGGTPLDEATSNNRKDIVDLLEQHMLMQARRNPRAALVQMTAQLKDEYIGSSFTVGRRSLIFKLASEVTPAPAISEEARKYFIEGTAIVKVAKNPAQQALAVQSFTEALKVAPWWGDAYYNLGVAQELAEQYDEAEKALTFYLLSNPGEQEKRDAQDRIYALSAKRKLLGAK